MTVAEVCAAGVPAIFVPYPFAVSDHQRANASFVVDHEGAWLLPQAEFDAERLAAVLARLDRQTLLERALRARSLARLDATDRAGQACLEVLHA